MKCVVKAIMCDQLQLQQMSLRGHLKSICPKYNVNMLNVKDLSLFNLKVNLRVDSELPLSVDVLIGNKTVTMQIDMGAVVSVISEIFYRINFSLLELIPSKTWTCAILRYIKCRN